MRCTSTKFYRAKYVVMSWSRYKFGKPVEFQTSDRLIFIKILKNIMT
jgi:hypothetical protein